MQVFATLDDLVHARAAADGPLPLGTGEWHEVSQHAVDLFAEATGDHQWIHTDPERAARGPFGGTIAHGYLSLSLLPLLMRTVYRVDGLRMAVNYGSNSVRFPAPLPVGSRVRARAELLGIVAKSGGQQLTVRATIEREHPEGEADARPVCVAETLAILYPA
ncbi:MaoC family dehydratase [Hoyosella sp. G463]|uniref:MaoC family dehydratase n=1 Tax=Lolliginicoccus lacisalsi TaxID=2742202 RepID=A0A927PLI0_9ACTN|nr:MaoC family dehydratase [Lolliginicoccus lacisalsi]MBD8505402.1 MaoC family dehydratase [Lolliginicoccus lacisalsi]